MENMLSVGRVVNVEIFLSPKAAARRNFGSLLLLGSSPVIDAAERVRSYTDIGDLARDFGMQAPEYQAALLYFSQSPRPSLLYVGRWCKTPQPALLKGGRSHEDPAAWTGIADGALRLSVNDVQVQLQGLDFSRAATMDGIAAILSAALETHGARCIFDQDHFLLSTTATGAGASLGFALPVESQSGTDIGSLAGLTRDLAMPPVPGMDQESAAAAAAALADVCDWYGLILADAAVTDDEHLKVAEFIEAGGRSRIYGLTVTKEHVLAAAVCDDVCSRLKALGLNRTFVQYSAHPFAVASAFGRAFTVNFNANRSTITLKFKQEPGVTAAGLTQTQAQTLAAKNCNVFTAYDNNTAILQEGVMAGGAFFDEIHGTDWLQNAVQTECWNTLYQSKTKIPQTNQGVNRIVTAVAKVLDQAVENGLVAPGIWNGDPLGSLETGQYLPSGYYIYAQNVDEQPQSEREQRKAPPIQVAAKLAGAVHFIDIQININR